MKLYQKGNFKTSPHRMGEEESNDLHQIEGEKKWIHYLLSPLQAWRAPKITHITIQNRFAKYFFQITSSL